MKFSWDPCNNDICIIIVYYYKIYLDSKYTFITSINCIS